MYGKQNLRFYTQKYIVKNGTPHYGVEQKAFPALLPSIFFFLKVGDNQLAKIDSQD